VNDQLERYRLLLVAVFSIPLVAGLTLLLADGFSDKAPPLTIEGPSDIRVYISGAVKNPGVYPATEGDRWIDVLEAAGGPGPDADLAAVNLAQRVHDEDQITVPGAGEGGPPRAGQVGLVNINTATEAELETLPGIGPVRAGNIVRSRTADGPFLAVDDLLGRELLPESVYEDLAPLITTSP